MQTNTAPKVHAAKPRRDDRQRKRRAKKRHNIAPRNPKAGAAKQVPDLGVQLRAAAKRSSVAHLTIEAKQGKVRQLAKFIGAQFPDAVTMHMVSPIMIVAYMDFRKEEGIADRTMQNDVSAIRTSFRDAGFPEIADAPEISCVALGIDDASRAGTKTAASVAQYELAVMDARLLSPALACCLRLQWTVGLRAMEAIRSGRSLVNWQHQLRCGQPLRVIDGTKGGRKRFVHVVDVEGTAQVIEEALEVMAANGGVLIPGSLKKAYSYYRHAMNKKIKMQGHCLRYAFTYNRVVAYLAQSCSLKEALGRTAEDLGHGKGRDAWVRRVYLNDVELGPLMEVAKDLAEARAGRRA